MPRVQAIVVRDGRVLMVLHHQHGEEWWCLPGGGLEPGETPEQGALRELREECNVSGTIIRQTSLVWYGPDDETYSFLVDIADQAVSLGHDPDVAPGQEVLAGLQWLRLCEIPERDRTFLWAAGLLGADKFLSEVEQWGDRISYPGDEDPSHLRQATANDAPDG
jgi:8-oxo-dGTP diphosphatase